MRAPLRPRDLTVLALVCVFALAASGSHVVQRGETLSDIAVRNGTSVKAIVEANDISNPNSIVEGQELSIPDGATGGDRADTYTVEEGDTLGRIAATFGTTVGALVRANDIRDPNLIRAGTTLTVEGSSGSAPAASSPQSGGNELHGQRHTVRPGDTIADIAARYGIDRSDFVAWNGLVDGRLYATAKLVLYDPGSLPGTSSASGPTTHTVAAGENLDRVARRYGTSISAIASASGIADPSLVRVGQTLTIPGGGGSTAAQCPVPGARFFNDWGFPRSGDRSHAGIDLFAPSGTPVHAPVSGTLDVATGTIGGKQFRLTSPDGTLWFGSHLSEFGATGSVSAGDVIGYVGDSGNARGSNPHLHFEVHPGSEAVNPFPFLRSAC